MRIVVGVDGSDASLTAIQLVKGTRWPTGAQIRLVGAYELPVDWTGVTSRPSYAVADVEAERTLFDTIQDLSQQLRRHGHAAKTVVARGRAADVLLAEADSLHADLLVVGSRGLGVAASALLGSVSAALVDHANCPVLVARGPTIRRILVATDGSQSAEAIPAVLLAWNVFRRVPIDVLSVAPPQEASKAPMLPHGWLGGEGTPLDASHEVDRHRVMADEMASRLTTAGWHAAGAVRRGEPAREIEQAAAEWDADLIVTGSRGLSGLRRLLLGSVAHHVLLHSPRSVLVMRGHVSARQVADVSLPRVAAAS